MTRHFCDECGQELAPGREPEVLAIVDVTDEEESKVIGNRDVCGECRPKVKARLLDALERRT